MRKFLVALAITLVGLTVLWAQAPKPNYSSPYPNFTYAAQSFTLTGQTGTALALPGVSYGTISAVGTSLTTATWAIQGSNDGGAHYFALNTALVTAPGTVATTETTTANALYIVNLSGITNVQFVTSGTFTGTSLALKLVATNNKGLL